MTKKTEADMLKQKEIVMLLDDSQSFEKSEVPTVCIKVEVKNNRPPPALPPQTNLKKGMSQLTLDKISQAE